MSLYEGFRSISQGFASIFAPSQSLGDLYDEYDKMMPLPHKPDNKNPFGIKIPLDKKDTR